MNPLFTKVALIATGIGGASAVGGGIYYLNSAKDEPTTKQENKEKQDTEVTHPKVTVSESISKLLKEKKLRLLTGESKDTTKWTESWNKFKGENASKVPLDPWKFTEWTQNKEKNETIDSFKKQCEEFSKTENVQESNAVFTAIKEYCTTTEEPAS